MKTVNIDQAKTTLSALLAEIERGEEVVIARNGTPVAKLVRITPPRARQPGLLHDVPEWRGLVYDPAVFAPMTDTELAEAGWE